MSETQFVITDKTYRLVPTVTKSGAPGPGGKRIDTLLVYCDTCKEIWRAHEGSGAGSFIPALAGDVTITCVNCPISAIVRVPSDEELEAPE